jgi:hypothetical protein
LRLALTPPPTENVRRDQSKALTALIADANQQLRAGIYQEAQRHIVVGM